MDKSTGGLGQPKTLIDAVHAAARWLDDAGVHFGHGTANAHDEAVWLVLWRLGLPLDTDLTDAANQNRKISDTEIQQLATLFEARIHKRLPAAYLTQEAWLQGVPFYVDERCIVPRSLIAECLAEGQIDACMAGDPARVLDLCTGNGSLAILAAMAWPAARVVGSDLSADALAVADINLHKHGLTERVRLVESDGLSSPLIRTAGPFDLILCNPPYVNARSMQSLPAEYLAEPAIALDGNMGGSTDGMDFIRPLLAQAAACMSANAVLVLEIGHERPFFETAFPKLPALWLSTSAGDDQVLLIRREDLLS
jgi:ribosomal protein L3 glutamine methyltransferase